MVPIDVARCRPPTRRGVTGLGRRRAMVPVDDARDASAAGGQILHDLTRAVCGKGERLAAGQEAGKRLEMAANGFRERGLESVINRPDTVSAMNA